MNPTTAGIKLAVALDSVISGTFTTANSVTETATAFWTAFTSELQRRRAERAAPQQAVPDAKPF